MSISEPFVRRPVATVLLAIGLMLLGIVAYRHLAVASLPNVDLPIIRVSASLPGADPETVAASLATPLERQLGTISGLNQITSINTLGSTMIMLQFEISKNVDDAARDVQAAINASVQNLPQDLPRLPTFFKANPAAFPILTLALTSDTLPPGKVYDYADTVVSQKLSQLEGVSEVDINGAEKSAVRVEVDPSALANMKLSLSDISTAIQSANVDGPKGSIQGDDRALMITATDQLFTAEDWGNIVIAWRNGAPVRLKDVAKVNDGVANTKLAGWFGDERGVVVSVRKKPDANTVETVDRIMATLPLLKRWMPPSVEMHVTADRTRMIRAAIADVQFTMLITIALVVLVIALFLRRFWATMIPSVTIPVSLLATFAVMYACRYSLDNLSLMALIVAVGFVVDDAIVMIENITRLIEEGHPPVEAAIRGSKQMGFTIVSITISLIAALIPILFMPGIFGLFFREFGVTLCAAILMSAVVSLTLTPMMCARFLSIGNLSSADGRFGRACERLLERTIDGYMESLTWALRHRWLMLAATIGAAVGTVLLFGAVPKGTLPTQDTGVIRGATLAPPDISFTAMSDRQRAVVSVIEQDPAVESITSNIGSNGFQGLNNGSITVNLVDASQRPRVEEIIERLRPQLEKVDGIQAFLSPVQDFGGGGRQGNARYQYTLHANDLPLLEHWANAMRDRLKALPEIADISTDQDKAGLQVNLKIDRARAGRLGVTMSAIDNALYNSFGQRQVATMYGPLDQFKVVLEVDPKHQGDLESLNRIFVPGTNASQVPLSFLVQTEPGSAPVQLNHQSASPAITISFNTKQDVTIGEAMAAIKKSEADAVFPEGVTGSFEGDARDAQDSNGSMPLLLFGAVIAVYVVLGMLYESYAHPLTILSTIPSASLGALLALIVTHTSLSIIAMIGIILLIGLVKKNAIMMVDFALEAERHDGLTPEQSILRAARHRFRPITMTTLAAVFGAVPIALGHGAGSEIRQPLGITIIGGLLVSQVLTLYTTPVIYLFIDRLRSRRTRRLPQVVAPAE
ncbi:MAG TPA: efflux RND transporter permease subunit [Aliidongia sp.]|nr:efflux RND transporter permease subunit [Aliidongia sp.]